jgi:hypothetical protein
MLKFLAVAAVTMSMGLFDVQSAQACGGGCRPTCVVATAPCDSSHAAQGATVSPPVATTPGPQAPATAAAPTRRSYRSYSYEPSTRSYGSSSTMRRSRGFSPYDAGRKIRGF